ncbi:MAG: arylsulfatase, partial [Akkermansiaceae bacterium]|nr:arylsulfatase [Akkermansiaceae bacterium]
IPIPRIWAGKKGGKSTPVKEFNLKTRATLDHEVVNRTSAFVKKQAAAGRPFFIYVAL